MSATSPWWAGMWSCCSRGRRRCAAWPGVGAPRKPGAAPRRGTAAEQFAADPLLEVAARLPQEPGRDMASGRYAIDVYTGMDVTRAFGGPPPLRVTSDRVHDVREQ